jgi:beta-aspartyl-peptidase (threonine type)
MFSTRLPKTLALLALALVLVPVSNAAAAASYDYYATGQTHGARAAATSPGLLLMGGGDWVAPAFSWFAAQAGHGHIVILRASGAAELQQDFIAAAGPVQSVETIVFHSRAAARDPRVLKVIRHADGIFLGGGDQANYVRYWQGTPLNAALDAHVRAGKPIGGTSAGLAILGAYSYGALDGDSLQSARALRDPLGPGVTLVRNFLHLPYLRNIITDTHFAIRERLGRLVVFVARLSYEESNPAITGLGIDEQAALCIDAQGLGRVYSNNGGYAWLLRPQRLAEVLEPGKPLGFSSVPVTGIGADSVLDLRHYSVDKPAFNWLATASGGAIRTEPVTIAGAARAATP